MNDHPNTKANSALAGCAVKAPQPVNPAYDGKHIAIKREVDALDDVIEVLKSLLCRISGEHRPPTNECLEVESWTLLETLNRAPDQLREFRDEALQIVRDIDATLFG